MPRLSLLAVAACFTIASLFAQAPNPENQAHAPDGWTREMISSISIPPVANAPFQATVTLEWTKHLGDGSTQIVRNHRLVVRDSQGSIYQERRTLVPDGSDQDSKIRTIEISNPVQHTKYFCNAELTQCLLRGYFVPPAVQPKPVPGKANGGARPVANRGVVGPLAAMRPNAKNPDLVRTELGNSTIEGLDAVGTRETLTIAPGKVGNSAPVELSKEFWYSPQLDLNLRVIRTDPLHGDQSFAVTDITVGEPDPQRFVIPAKCKVIDLRKKKNSQQQSEPEPQD